MTGRPGTEAHTKYSSGTRFSALSGEALCAVVLGPTASGKSDLALCLASKLQGEIVNFDSVQLYRGFDIGSAKPSANALATVRHHLIDIVDAPVEMTAGEYARRAADALRAIAARGSTPILAGGTGFYLRALLNGLCPAPQKDETIRSRLAGLRTAVLYRFLLRFDPAAAAHIHRNDRQKLSRAVEMIVLAGRPASEIQSGPRRSLSGFTAVKIGLAPERSRLNERIEARTRWMFAHGLVEETKRLLEGGVSPDAKPMQSLGYKQALKLIAGELTLEEAILECQTRTRQYAKRQMTWFRREPDVHWIHGFGDDAAVQEQAAAILLSAQTAAGNGLPLEGIPH